jgi:hypothetical protein
MVLGLLAGQRALGQSGSGSQEPGGEAGGPSKEEPKPKAKQAGKKHKKAAAGDAAEEKKADRGKEEPAKDSSDKN